MTPTTVAFYFVVTEIFIVTTLLFYNQEVKEEEIKKAVHRVKENQAYQKSIDDAYPNLPDLPDIEPESQCNNVSVKKYILAALFWIFLFMQLTGGFILCGYDNSHNISINYIEGK